jgi:hypothetical protein
MNENNPNEIKVVDRRMFNSDGSLRDDAVVEEPRPAQAPAPSPASARVNPITGAPLAPQAEAHHAPPPPMEEEPEPAYEEAVDEGADDEPEMNEFMEFLMQMASSAFIYLGMMEHPATGTRQINPPAARQSIDMLVMLREKTKGNLTSAEEKFFDGLLHDLQMQYVALSQRVQGMR